MSDAVVRARERGLPLVALESSIWCQGLPYPENLEGARRVARAVEDEGAVPAVLAASGGEIRVGIDPDELADWCEARDAVKMGLRDLGWVLARGCRGATTVSASLAISHAAGIEVFVTGGIGGVHHGGRGHDVSTDLAALAEYPVCVISSGAKSILDIEATLERLETLGVCVAGYGTDRFPVFYAPGSRWPVTVRLDSVEEVAAAWRAARGFGLRQSMLVAHPVPREDGLDENRVDGWVAEATAEANRQGVGGKALTPFLLSYLANASDGATLHANLSLIVSNARLGAKIARALCGDRA